MRCKGAHLVNGQTRFFLVEFPHIFVDVSAEKRQLIDAISPELCTR